MHSIDSIDIVFHTYLYAVNSIISINITNAVYLQLGFFKRKKFDGNITDAEREEMMKESKKEKQPFET